MGLARRRVAALEAPLDAMASRTLLRLRAAGSPEAAPSSTISPFDKGLNGVDQPQNMMFKDALWWMLGATGMIILGIRLLQYANTKLRLITMMGVPGEKQGYWKHNRSSWMPRLKKHLLYAPLWKTRHSRGAVLFKSISMGCLPSRLHFLMLLTYIICNFAYMLTLGWSRPDKYSATAELRGRSGTLAVVNMIPLVIFAGRNNLLISLLRISFDTYNLFHRWLGRLVVVLIIVHFSCWYHVQLADGGWASVGQRLSHEVFLASGTAGAVAMLFVLVLSPSPVRSAFYETFLNIHIILVVLILAATWVHCAKPTNLPPGESLPQHPWAVAIVFVFAFERLTRFLRLVVSSYSVKNGWAEAVVEPMPAGASRVTIRLPRHVDVKPGTHAYIRFGGVHPWENHPFSIAWVEHEYAPSDIKFLSMSEESEVGYNSTRESSKVLLEPAKPVRTNVSFVIGAQAGMTRRLYDKARGTGLPAITMRAAFEGPYGGHQRLDSYGHAVLFAGATGITHQIGFVRHLVEGYASGTVATRRVVLIWIVRDIEALEWVRPWMEYVLRLPRRKEILHIKLFVTRVKNPKELASESTTVQMFPGRPDVPMLLAQETAEQQGAMVVSVCGPGSLADTVRGAAIKAQDTNQVCSYVEESFSW